jgi:hypothetical protein
MQTERPIESGDRLIIGAVHQQRVALIEGASRIAHPNEGFRRRKKISGAIKRNSLAQGVGKDLRRLLKLPVTEKPITPLICVRPEIRAEHRSDHEHEDQEQRDPGPCPPNPPDCWRFLVHDVADVLTIQPGRNQSADKRAISGINQ